MLSKGQAYFPWWKATMKLCNLCFAIPYKWDEKSSRVKLIGKISKYFYNITLLTHLIYLGIMCIHMGINYKIMSLGNCLKALVAIFTSATCGLSRVTFWFWEKDCLKMINGFLEFETQFIQKFAKMDPEIGKAARYAKVVFFVGTSSAATFGVFIFILLLMEPCTPPYIGSMRSKCLNGGADVEKQTLDFATLCIITFDGWMWFHIAQPAALALGNIMLGFCLSLKKYLTVLSSVLDKMILVSSTYRTKEVKVLDIFGYYPQLRLLVIQMNVTFKDLFIPGGFAVTSNAAVFSLYICIRLHSVIPMPGFIFFPLILTDAMLIIAVDFASAGFVYLKSKSVVEGWRKMDWLKSKKRSLICTNVRSFAPLKIRFGMNFIDELTSLTVLDYCLNQTVSLLLMKK